MAAAIISGVGTAFSIGSSLKAGSSTKKEANKQQRIERMMTAEEIRRLQIEHEQVTGSARAQIAASGFTGYGANTQEYLENLKKEQSIETEFAKRVGGSRAAAIKDRGNSLASSYNTQALSSLFQGVSQIGSAFNWGLDETTTGTD